VADGISVTLIGFDKLDANLLELNGATGERIIRKAMRAGGEVVQAAITDLAPVRTDGLGGDSSNPAWNLPPGALKSDIQLTVTKDKQTGSIAAYIEPGRYSKFVATMVEYGHEIAKGGKLGKSGRGKVIGHVPAHPFVRPAMDLSTDAAIEAIETTIAAEILKQIQKIGG
jgi:Bacteriophage HK97-gp10, putative tail-component